MIPGTVLNPAFLASASASTAEVDDWVARIKSAGGTVNDSTVLSMRTFVKGCKQHGLWTKLLDVGVFAGNSLVAGLVKLKYYPGSTTSIYNMVSATDANYSESYGYNPTTSYRYLDSGVRLDYITSDGTNLHLAMYGKDGFLLRPMGVHRNSVATRHYLVYNDYSISPPGFAWGALTSGGNNTAGFRIATHYSGTKGYNYLNGSVLDSVNLDYSKPSEWSCGIGVSHGSSTGSSAESGVYFGATSKTFQFYSIGYGLSPDDVVAYNTLVHALQTALGRA